MVDIEKVRQEIKKVIAFQKLFHSDRHCSCLSILQEALAELEKGEEKPKHWKEMLEDVIDAYLEELKVKAKKELEKAEVKNIDPSLPENWKPYQTVIKVDSTYFLFVGNGRRFSFESKVTDTLVPSCKYKFVCNLPAQTGDCLDKQNQGQGKRYV